MGHSNANVSLCTLEGMDYLPRLEDMDFVPRLRLLHWNSYPGTSLPTTLRPEFLIELNMPSSKFEKLWGGIQPLVNLKKVNLNFCSNLKEIPNLSRATNLETLTFIQCKSLVKFPSSITNLYKLTTVRMWGCNKLQVVPTNNNSEPLQVVPTNNNSDPHDIYSSISKVFPDISKNVENLWRGGPSIGSPWFGRRRFDVVGRLTHVPESVTKVDLSSSGIERIPTYVRPQILDVVGPRLTHVPQSLRKLDLSGSGIKRLPDYVCALYRLQTLNVENCRKLMSLEDLPSSLKSLQANNCVSLERVEFSMLQQDSDSIRELMFHNCLRLDKEARRVIINRRYVEYACLPGKQVPAEFTHKAAGNSITISPGSFSTASSRFQVCFLLSPIKDNPLVNVTCYLRNKEGVHINQVNYLTKLNPGQSPQVRTQHLFILGGDLSRQQNRSPKVDVNTGEILFEFTCSDNHKIIECGVRILKEEVSIGGNSNNNTDGDDDEAGYVKVFQGSRYISCWRWLMKLYSGGRL